jgi:serine/threonine protein kinase
LRAKPQQSSDIDRFSFEFSSPALVEYSLNSSSIQPGAFAGTPEFASPEQFAGVSVDIRSDLYSLGVTLWAMVTGQTPFRGPSAQVMYQHQPASLPLERLKDLPQPVVVLLEKLLEKDPAQPDELLKAMPTITGAIEAPRGITRRSLQQIPPPTSRVGTRKPPARLGPKKISVARLPITGSDSAELPRARRGSAPSTRYRRLGGHLLGFSEFGLSSTLWRAVKKGALIPWKKGNPPATVAPAGSEWSGSPPQRPGPGLWCKRSFEGITEHAGEADSRANIAQPRRTLGSVRFSDPEDLNEFRLKPTDQSGLGITTAIIQT